MTCTKLKAFWLGVKDGWAQPHDLSMGLTWDDRDDLNLSYDRGANVGQFLGRVMLRREREL
jgi:hypothetical protein